MTWDGRAFDAWLTNQPEFPVLVEQPDYSDYDEDEFPTDAWFCRDCQTPLGFYLCGDDSGAWRDHVMLPDEVTRICEPCFELVLPLEPDEMESED